MTAGNEISELGLWRSESTVWQLTLVRDTVLSKCIYITKAKNLKPVNVVKWFWNKVVSKRKF